MTEEAIQGDARRGLEGKGEDDHKVYYVL